MNQKKYFLKKEGTGAKIIYIKDENSDLFKVLKKTKKGIETAQKVGKTYNKFAQWLALPQVPNVLL